VTIVAVESSKQYVNILIVCSAAFVIQHAVCMRMRRIVVCGLSGSTVLYHIISLAVRLKKNVSEHTNMCFDCLCYFHMKHF
jgi:hypothetical protein